MKECDNNKNALNAQQGHWERTYGEAPDFFGEEPSYPAQEALKFFKKEGKTNLLELGGGQGRDTFYFAQNGLQVHVLDYSESGINTINEKAQKLGLSHLVKAITHDVRKPLPFNDASFDCCFSHMLYNMAFTTTELEFLSQEIRRMLKPNGLNIYTARNTNDKHYKTGIHRCEDMYEVNGFNVHFFSREKVKRLAKCYEIVSIDEFEEGTLPRKLFLVALKKLDSQQLL
jgi:ubiquinone/menaquinone biosynthesis C-methylase UbiE